MLKFIDENDFNLVDVFQLNENGTVSWKRNHLGVSGSGIIREGLTRTKQIQNGTEMVVVGQVQTGTNPGTGEPIMEDISEERPTYETVVINVWDKLWELHNDPDSDVTVNPLVIDYAAEKLKYRNLIDMKAGEVRLAFVSQGQLVEEEYRLALEDARAWDGTGDVPATIQVWADAAGMTTIEARDDILTTSAQWNGALSAIRSLRLTGKAAVASCTDGDEAATAQTYINQLEALKP